MTAATVSIRRPPALLRELVEPRTWLGAAHLLLDVAVGFATCAAVGAWLLASALLFPFALIGVPVFVGAAHLSEVLGRIERLRYRTLLGVDIAGEPLPARTGRLMPYAGVLLRDPGVRRRILHQLLAFPIGLITSALVYWVITLGVVLLLMPLLGLFLPTSDATIFDLDLSNVAARIAMTPIGAALLLVTPWLVRGLVAADVTVARSLLGRVPGSLTARVGELERSRARVVDSAEAERRRIERDLHDSTQQQLVSLAMTLGRAKARYRTEPHAVGPLLDDAHQQAKDAVTDLRGLIRGLAPPVLADRGLDAALSAVAARCPVPVDLTVELERRPHAVVEAIGYFVVAEALTNVAKHARASRAAVAVRSGEGSVWITVSDDGRGGAHPDGGSGLRGLADRVSGVDGQLSVDSPVGGPTVLTVELPE